MQHCSPMSTVLYQFYMPRTSNKKLHLHHALFEGYVPWYSEHKSFLLYITVRFIHCSMFRLQEEKRGNGCGRKDN